MGQSGIWCYKRGWEAGLCIGLYTEVITNEEFFPSSEINTLECFNCFYTSSPFNRAQHASSFSVMFQRGLCLSVDRPTDCNQLSLQCYWGLRSLQNKIILIDFSEDIEIFQEKSQARKILPTLQLKNESVVFCITWQWELGLPPCGLGGISV